ncbi:MAG: DUF1987 domain-containing protein [Hyphomicrobiales bacterium]|nr:DUF1987 domain-containing protein [Hyphomicrobiales bacterium]MCP5374096.1 DUF1987 domain-containing protein [Hyphomicrobiales bacterium]
MDRIDIAGTDRSPEVVFDFDTGRFSLRGMAYLENAAKFFEPLLDKLEAHLEAHTGATVDFEFELTYFNSSAARILIRLFDLLDEAAGRGNRINIAWIYDSEDDNLEEMGEEMGEDLENAKFEMRPVET